MTAKPKSLYNIRIKKFLSMRVETRSGMHTGSSCEIVHGESSVVSVQEVTDRVDVECYS